MSPSETSTCSDKHICLLNTRKFANYQIHCNNRTKRCYGVSNEREVPQLHIVQSEDQRVLGTSSGRTDMFTVQLPEQNLFIMASGSCEEVWEESTKGNYRSLFCRLCVPFGLDGSYFGERRKRVVLVSHLFSLTRLVHLAPVAETFWPFVFGSRQVGCMCVVVRQFETCRFWPEEIQAVNSPKSRVSAFHPVSSFVVRSAWRDLSPRRTNDVQAFLTMAFHTQGKFPFLSCTQECQQ